MMLRRCNADKTPIARRRNAAQRSARMAIRSPDIPRIVMYVPAGHTGLEAVFLKAVSLLAPPGRRYKGFSSPLILLPFIPQLTTNSHSKYRRRQHQQHQHKQHQHKQHQHQQQQHQHQQHGPHLWQVRLTLPLAQALPTCSTQDLQPTCPCHEGHLLPRRPLHD